VTLAHALSSKMCKAGVPHQIINNVNDLENYDIEINLLEEQGLTFLNVCVDACHCIHDRFCIYNKLKFIVFNTPMQDSVRGASPLKPDSASSNRLSEWNKQLWWCPESGDHSSTMEIPIEVKNCWFDLILQAATYSHALISARPLCQFSLVIAYNHIDHQL
jgi:hypothetical protein